MKDHDHSQTNEPAEVASVLDSGVNANQQTVLAISGMDCPDEVAILEKTLGPLAGVREVRASLMASKITVTHDARVSAEQLIKAIAPTGMSAHLPKQGEQASDTSAAGQRWRKITVGISGALTGLGLILQWTNTGPEWLRIPIFAVAIIAGGWFIFPKAVAALRRFSPDMNLLMSVAVIGAAIIGECHCTRCYDLFEVVTIVGRILDCSVGWKRRV